MVAKADINKDLDRYLRGKKKGYAGPSWWDGMFSPKPKELPRDELSPAEMRKLQSMEMDLKREEEKMKTVREYEHELEDDQEEKVSFYHKMRRMFGRDERADTDDVVELPEEAPKHDTGVVDDFRTLAQIQMRWFDRLPTRVKEEFKESDDYRKYVEILQRRGVAKKR